MAKKTSGTSSRVTKTKKKPVARATRASAGAADATTATKKSAAAQSKAAPPRQPTRMKQQPPQPQSGPGARVDSTPRSRISLAGGSVGTVLASGSGGSSRGGLAGFETGHPLSGPGGSKRGSKPGASLSDAAGGASLPQAKQRGKYSGSRRPDTAPPRRGER